MPDSIADGTGTSYLAMVDDENHLHTTSSTEPLIAHYSRYSSSSYGLSTPMLTINTTGGRALWIKNSDPTKDFYFTDFWFNWNGGSTNYNTPMYGQMVFGDTEPTTNITEGGAGNLNRASAVPANLTVLYWDETGDGMTGYTAGGVAFYWCNGQGSQHYETGGAIILGANNTISFNLQGGEDGKASINILGYFK